MVLFIWQLGIQVQTANNDGQRTELFKLYYDGTKENHRNLSRYPGSRFKQGIFGERHGTNTIVGNYKQLYEYNSNDDKWDQIQKEEDIKVSRYESKGCFIQDTYLLFGGDLENHDEVLRFSSNHSDYERSTSYLDQDIFSPTTLPFESVYGHTNNKVRDKTIIIASGNYKNGVLYFKLN